MLTLAPWNIAVLAASFISSIALAWVLGAGTGTDAYFVGLSGPVFVYSVLLVAVRSGAISPLTDLLDKDDKAFDDAGSQIVSATAVASLVCSLLLTAAAVVALPALIDGSEQFAFMTRVTVLELAPLGVLGAVTGALGALLAVRRVFVPQVAVMAIEPLVKTVLTLTIGHRIGAQALVIGNLVGSSLAVLVLWNAVKRHGISVRLGGPIDTPLVREAIAVSAPLLVSASVLQINPVVDRTMAADLSRGSVTTLELGLRLFVVPVTLLTATLTTPLTATWAARRLDGGWFALQASLGRIVTLLSMSMPPVIVLGFVLRHQLVSILYHGGAYTASAAHETSQVFGVLLLGLPAQLTAVTLSTLFVVYRATVFNMKIGIANVFLNVALNWALRPLLGVAGIALSTTITLTILAGAYAVGVKRRWGGLRPGVMKSAVARTAVSVAVTSVVAVGLLSALPSWSSRAGQLVLVLVVAATGLVAHCLVLHGERRRWIPRLAARIGHVQRAEVVEP
jgi:putative peptidoglycan lipid II flippase